MGYPVRWGRFVRGGGAFRGVLFGAVWGSVCLFVCGSAGAQDPHALPQVEMLSCGSACKAATEPKAVEGHTATFPGFIPEMYPTEGVVVLRATVTKEGTLKDQIVVSLAGPKVFAEESLKASSGWLYRPATRNGIPVDRPNWQIRFIFAYVPPVLGARDDIYRDLRIAIHAAGEKNYQDSDARLQKILQTPHLNLYERAVAILQLGANALQQKDYLSASEYIDEVFLIGDQYLPKALRPTLYVYAIYADMQTGRYSEAWNIYNCLKEIKPYSVDETTTKLAAIADAQVHGNNSVTTRGRVVKSTGVWVAPVLRHTLTFLRVSGRLDTIQIECGERSIQSPFSANAEWHVPQGWDGCRLLVFGDPGAEFTVVQLDK